jgi:probable HAF family extracellular repeat protein
MLVLEELERRDLLSSNTQQFVSAIYPALLGRHTDPIGLMYWSALIDQGRSRDEVVLEIESSPEYRTNLLQGFYQDFLKRDADSVGLSFFGVRLADGWTREQVQAALLGSTEYYEKRAGGTDDGFLSALYQDLLSRPLDPVGSAAWHDLLAQAPPLLGSGNVGIPLYSPELVRSEIALNVLTSSEARAIQVASYYREFLHRDVDTTGEQFWTGNLLGGASADATLAGIVGSLEYLDYVTVHGYSFVTIDVPGSVETDAYGINDSGQVVGYYLDHNRKTHGFLLHDGIYSTIDVPDAVETQVFGINDSGDIVGVFREPDRDGLIGFLMTGDAFHVIYVPDSFETIPHAINDAGQIVGEYTSLDFSGTHGFLFNQDSFTPIDTPFVPNPFLTVGGHLTIASGINTQGQVVGITRRDEVQPYTSFVEMNGNFIPIAFGSANTPYPLLLAHGINSDAEIVGEKTVRTADGSFSSLGFFRAGANDLEFGVPNSVGTEFRGINNFGQIVGTYDNGGTHSFLATPSYQLPGG